MLSFEVGPCHDVDPGVFHPGPDAAEAVARARTICARCAIRPDCLALALRTGKMDGIWGGLTAIERARYITTGFGSMTHRR
jgi:WhiB family transcriptional regulator, redox-sensing transcriptional regulator